MLKDKSKNLRLDIALTIALFSMEAIVIFALTPLYTAFMTNYLYKATVIPTIFRYAIDLFDTLIRSIGFATIAAATFMSVKKMNCYAVYAGAICFRLVGNILMSLLLYRSLELNEIIMALNVLLIDALVFVVGILIIKAFEKKKAASIKNNENGFFNKINVYKKQEFLSPIVPCLFGIGAFLTLVKLLTRTIGLIQDADLVIKEIKLIFKNIDVLLTSEYIPSMTVGYLTDILVLPIAFLCAGGFLIFLYKKNESRKAIAKLYEN